MKKSINTFIVWGAALAVLSLGAYLYFVEAEQAGNAGGGRFGGGGRAVSVALTPVQLAQFSDVIEAVGTSAANESLIITARVSETVQTVNFTDGQQISKGDVIVELTNTEERGQVGEAEANVREAKRQYDRIQNLVKTGNTSQSVLDQRTRELEASQSRLAQARARLNDRILTAPFGGVLGLRKVSVGTLVSPGMEITTLDDLSIIKADFSVPERFLASLKPGQKIETRTAAYRDEIFIGLVETIASRVDPRTRTVTVRALVPNENTRLRAGMLLVVDLISNERTSLAVNEMAIVAVGDDEFVYTVDADMKAQRNKVITGVRINGLVEIISGLKEDDRVVTGGTIRVRPGVTVRDLNAAQEKPTPKT
jgi:membrane fusion protein (multidrug efflux system)